MSNKSLLITCIAALAAGLLIGVLTQGHKSSNSASCQTFTHTYQPGLMDTFKGTVCADNAGVQRIATQYKLCVKQTGSTPQCGYALLQYLASSGAYPEDAAKAELLVLSAASGA